MTLKEAEIIVETVSSRIHPDSHIIWGAMIDEKLPKHKIMAMVIVTGGKFPFLEDVNELAKKGTKGIDLGIEFTG